MDRVAYDFSRGLSFAIAAVLVGGLGALGLLVWGVTRLRSPNRGLGAVMLFASLVPFLTVVKWLLESSLAWKRPAEWVVPLALTVLFATLGGAHIVAARRREALLFRASE